MTTTTGGRSTLPVMQTVSAAFQTVPAHWQAVLRIFGAWTAILIGLVVLLQFQSFPQDIGQTPMSSIALLNVAIVVVGMLALASTAVAWHRLILLGEQPPAIHLGVDGRVLRYLGRLLLIGLIALPVMAASAILMLPLLNTFLPLMFPPAPLAAPSPGHFLTLSVINLLVSVPAILVMARFGVGLPGIAIGHRMTLRETWRATEGNTASLLGATLLVYVPAFAIGMAYSIATQLALRARLQEVLQQGAPQLAEREQFVQIANELRPTLLLTSLPMFLMNLVITVVAISVLSLSYRFLVGTAAADPGPGPAEAD